MFIFTIIGMIVAYCLIHIFIFGGQFKLSLNNPVNKFKKLFIK
jgi:hypothetical protein